ncbi:MAG: hypothetical protein WKG32_10305 [Gemmatimonadaceae bacterium]
MTAQSGDAGMAMAGAVESYRASGDLHALLDRIAAIASGTEPHALAAAVEPFRDMPEVAGPAYEQIVAARPDDSRALVILANAYWLAGRGPEVVGELAARAIAADPGSRGAWHLWALTESDPRARVTRWSQVAERFPEDDLARANLADNAASLAGAEGDAEALALAIRTYESLLATASHTAQRAALTRALETLRGWKL